MSSPGPSHIVSKETVQATRWLRFVKVMYANDAGGKAMPWDAVERVTTAEGGIDAVIAITIIKKTGQQSKLLVVKQVRNKEHYIDNRILPICYVLFLEFDHLYIFLIFPSGVCVVPPSSGEIHRRVMCR